MITNTSNTSSHAPLYLLVIQTGIFIMITMTEVLLVLLSYHLLSHHGPLHLFLSYITLIIRGHIIPESTSSAHRINWTQVHLQRKNVTKKIDAWTPNIYLYWMNPIAYIQGGLKNDCLQCWRLKEMVLVKYSLLPECITWKQRKHYVRLWKECFTFKTL